MKNEWRKLIVVFYILSSTIMAQNVPKTKFVQARPCPRICQLVPTNVPGARKAQAVLHPRKDVFVLRVAKIGTMGERRCKMELELVTPKGPERKVPSRIDTKGTQCLPPPCAGCCQRIQC